MKRHILSVMIRSFARKRRQNTSTHGNFNTNISTPEIMRQFVNVEEYLSLRQQLVPILREIHGTGQDAFWNIALFFYVGDILKAKLTHTDQIGYDNIAHKELLRWGRPERVNRGAIDNILEIVFHVDGVHSKHDTEKASIAFSSTLGKVALFVVLMLRYWFRDRSLGNVRRIRINDIAQMTEDALVVQSLKQLPVHLVEDFEFYTSLRMRYSKPLDTRKMKNGLAITFAAFGERGGTTRLRQHGGFYGEVRTKDIIEASLPTYFHTWGWAYAQHHVPSRSDLLDAFASRFEKHDRTNSDLLIVLPTYLDDVHAQKLAHVWPDLVRISDETGLNLIVRHRPRKVARADRLERDRIQEIVSKAPVAFSRHKAMEDALAGAALSVCLSHPATAFLQALRVNAPVLALMTDRDWYLPEYLPFVNALEKLNLLHSSTRSLICSLSRVAPDPAAWWNDVSQDSRLQEYRRTYCGIRDCAESE